jgi:sugar-phosphatase
MNANPKTNIQAVVYDMDGVLIDSEPLWRDIIIESFKTVGVHLTNEMCAQTRGRRVDDVVRYWLRYGGKGEALAVKVEDLIWEKIIACVKEEGKAKEGVRESLEFFKEKGIPLALASTSAFVLIDTVLDKLNIRHYFSYIYSGELEEYGKPHPGIYMHTMEKLGVVPDTSIAIEDSFNGILAAKAAKMRCIAVPDETLQGDARLSIADAVIPSLLDVNEELLRSI